MTITVISSLLKPFGKPFKVSRKGETKTELALNPVVGLPLIAMIALYVPAIIHAIMHAQWFPDRGIFVLAIGWSAYSLTLLWLSLQASMDVPQPTSSLRFKHQLPVTLRQRGLIIEGMTDEISDADVVLRLDELALNAGIRFDEPLTVSFAQSSLREMPVSFLEEDAEGRIVMKFERMPIAQQRALVAFLFCRPGQWDEQGVSEHVTFWRFIQAPFRMYPLAETH
jgi:cellulose synthase (UDP-forming)